MNNTYLEMTLKLIPLSPDTSKIASTNDNWLENDSPMLLAISDATLVQPVCDYEVTDLVIQLKTEGFTLDAKGQTHYLKERDVIKIGSSFFKVQILQQHIVPRETAADVFLPCSYNASTITK